VDAFTVKLANGDYDRLPEWKRLLTLNLIDVLQGYREAGERGEAFDVDAGIRDAVAKLGAT
jgi:hypothetical protein